jgi:hypothetical protein
LVEAVPFTAGLVVNNGIDWLLRAGRQGACVVFPKTAESLAVWHIEDNRPRLSNTIDW